MGNYFEGASSPPTGASSAQRILLRCGVVEGNSREEKYVLSRKNVAALQETVELVDIAALGRLDSVMPDLKFQIETLD